LVDLPIGLIFIRKRTRNFSIPNTFQFVVSIRQSSMDSVNSKAKSCLVAKMLLPSINGPLPPPPFLQEDWDVITAGLGLSDARGLLGGDAFHAVILRQLRLYLQRQMAAAGTSPPTHPSLGHTPQHLNPLNPTER
jgi:hypothetical protein